MHTFDHPNVLKLTGVCLDGGPAPYIIMPFMTNGSLLSYLKKEREHVLIEPESAACHDVVSEQCSLHWCTLNIQNINYTDTENFCIH